MYTEAEYSFDYSGAIKKVVVVLLIAAVITGIIFIINKPQATANYFEDNINTMASVATSYYKDHTINEKITLKEMIDKKMLGEFIDENGNSCDINNSYAIRENNQIKVFLKCNTNEETKINNLI